MKKLSNWLKNTFSSKKTENHEDPSKRSSMKMNLKETWTKRMDSTHNKMSEGASEHFTSLRSSGGSNSRINGREHDKGHHEANNMHKLNKKNKTK